MSTVGVKEDKEALRIWADGMDEAIKQLTPSIVLEYGGDIGYNYGGVEVRRYENKVLGEWKNGR